MLTLLKLIPIKHIIGGLAIFISVITITTLSIIIWCQSNTIYELESDLTAVKTEAILKDAIYEEERKKAKETLLQQNEAINRIKSDKEKFEKAVRQKEKELTVLKYEKQQAIEEALRQDISPENQLRIINNLLKGFSTHEN